MPDETIASPLQKLIARIRALATSALTLLMGLAVILPWVATQVTDEVALQWIARAIVFVGGAILVLRRVVELPWGKRGILVNPPIVFPVAAERVETVTPAKAVAKAPAKKTPAKKRGS